MEAQAEVARLINEEITRRVQLAMERRPEMESGEEGVGPTMAGYLAAYAFGGQPAGRSNGQGPVTPFGRIEEPGSCRVPPLVFVGGSYKRNYYGDGQQVSK